MRIHTATILALVLLVHGVGNAQARDSSYASPLRLIVLGGVTSATVVAVHLYQQNAWWQGSRAPFRFENDWNYALNIDKFGHAFGAYILSHLFSYGLRWGGLHDSAAVLYGSLFGLGYQLYVEVEDGFHKDYGFSPGDAIADVAGAMLPVAQMACPVLSNFTLKWSYYPSSEYQDALRQGVPRVFIDDYQGQIYWLAVDPHFLMSDGLSRAVPSWFGFAVGLSARNLDLPSQRRLIPYVSLDYNFSKIGTGSDLLHAIFVLIDHIHLPAPALYYDRGQWKAGIVY
jgi:hypothetical protein